MSKDTRSSTGEMGDTAFADALIGALQKKTEKENVAKENVVKDVVAATAPALPDLDKIEVCEVVIPKYDGNTAKTEADETKQYAEAAGSKLTQIRENLEKIRLEIRKIDKDPNAAFSATAKSLLVRLRTAEASEMAKEKQLLGIKDEAVKSHIEFSALLEEIRGTDPTHLGEVREVFDRIHKTGLRELVSKDEFQKIQEKHELPRGQGPIFFEGEISVPVSATSGQRGLESELRKLIDAAKFSKAASIKMRGNADLSGFKSGKPGTYYFFNPKRTESDGRKFFEGHALVEIRDVNHGKFVVDRGQKVKKSPFVVVEVRDAIDSLSRLVSDRWIPHFWINEGRVVSKGKDRLEKDDFDHAVHVIRTLRALFVIWQEGLNPKPEAKKVEVPSIEGPIVNPVTDTDMSGIVVETKPVTAKSSAAEEKPKTKKVKKA